MKKLLILPVLFLLTATAMADQCAYVTKDQADAAVKILKQNEVAYHFCELCGDTEPRKIQITSVENVSTGWRDFYEVTINGTDADLAYTYDQNGYNLAMQVGCETNEVSAEIEVQ
ncbi:MAG: hypothetical protein KC493_09315 [Bacteriovoracaceae bacterium]|nr:hypothetical protein [Bacteriovoracaceae bacterium]